MSAHSRVGCGDFTANMSAVCLTETQTTIGCCSSHELIAPSAVYGLAPSQMKINVETVYQQMFQIRAGGITLGP